MTENTQTLPNWKDSLTKIEFVSTPCPVCKQEVSTLKYVRPIKGYTMKYYICSNCNALYANPRITVESLRSLYASSSYFQGGDDDNFDYSDFIGSERYLRLTARDRISRIQKYCQTGKMLEVASAAGFFLIEAKNAGYDVSGVEFSAPMAEYASKRWSVKVIPESIELVDLPTGEYDAIASWGVSIIIQDPIAMIQKFHRALKPGGIWAFNTYYHDGLWARLLGKHWYILILNFSQIYSKKSIIDIVEKQGFKLLSRRREMPYTDVSKVINTFAIHTLRMPWIFQLSKKIGIDKIIIKIPLPDVFEYIFQKH